METQNATVARRVPWSKGKLTGKKPPLTLREFWVIRTRLQMSANVRELAMFQALGVRPDATARAGCLPARPNDRGEE